MTIAQADFKTTYRHRSLGALWRRSRPYLEGQRDRPVLVRLDPLPGAIPSAKPPVRIFLGTEPAQYRAERVFVWSIVQARDPARAYEIHLMKGLKGFESNGGKTSFATYRYAVPALAGGAGRAIYNSVGQIYLADPAELFDADLNGAGVASLAEGETSVMLLDCTKMIEVWPLDEARTSRRHKHYRQAARAGRLWSPLPPAWHARDGEFVLGASKLMHFATLHKQPWQPFPRQLNYEPHERADLWHHLERAADAAGFTIFTKERPSERYLELLGMYQRMHAEGRPEAGRSSAETFDGKSLKEHIAPIARLIAETGARTLLDFGSGKARLYDDSPDHAAGSRYKVMPGWHGVTVTCYDPGYEPFAGRYDDAYDAVISTDVVEHIPEDDIAWVLDEMFGRARKFVYVVAHCSAAKKKRLPDGSNVHCTIMPPEWWHGQMALAARRNPHTRWVLCTQEHSAFAFHERRGLMKGIRHRVFTGSGATLG